MGARSSAALLAALALAAAGCGGSSSEGGPGESSNGAPVKGKKGGKVTFLAAADVDYLDPGQTYYTFGYMVAYATQRPLYSFKPDEADKPVPDLAEGEPQISKDNKTITVKLRSGVKFSPPVNREVTSKDVKYAFERAFTANVPSGYATSYFGDIKGAPDGPGKFKSIPGIKTPDDQHDRLRARQADRRDGRGRARDADHDPGAAGVRGEVRQARARRRMTSTRSSRAPTWSATTPRQGRRAATRAS